VICPFTSRFQRQSFIFAPPDFAPAHAGARGSRPSDENSWFGIPSRLTPGTPVRKLTPQASQFTPKAQLCRSRVAALNHVTLASDEREQPYGGRGDEIG
jgi:hypothetical protein